jgi:thioredoxin-like negative regulator of GroEL
MGKYGDLSRQREVTDYQKAWELLLKRIEETTSWGKEQLKQVMLECLIQAGSKDETSK